MWWLRAQPVFDPRTLVGRGSQTTQRFFGENAGLNKFFALLGRQTRRAVVPHVIAQTLSRTRTRTNQDGGTSWDPPARRCWVLSKTLARREPNRFGTDFRPQGASPHHPGSQTRPRGAIRTNLSPRGREGPIFANSPNIRLWADRYNGVARERAAISPGSLNPIPPWWCIRRKAEFVRGEYERRLRSHIPVPVGRSCAGFR